jgi:hypothetical protein
MVSCSGVNEILQARQNDVDQDFAAFGRAWMCASCVEGAND